MMKEKEERKESISLGEVSDLKLYIYIYNIFLN